MQSIRYTLWGWLALLSLLWVAVNGGVFRSGTFWALRDFLIQYSGFMAIGCMSLAMMLSLRPRWPERRLGGLDKMYRLHKWLGIGVLLLASTHWLWKEAPKWVVRAELLARPQKGPRTPPGDPLEAVFRSLRGTAEGLGEWTFYGVVLLLLVALLPIVPYRRFRQVHRLMPVAYLVLVFHAVVLFDFADWTTPPGLVLAVLLAGGSYAALASLSGRVGRGRRTAGTIVGLRRFPGIRSLETVVELAPGWPGHRPGQFAFVTADPKEGAHPYTIASAWSASAPRIAFVTKALGDYTAGLADRLRLGQPVEVEGPYGCFTFDDERPRQIWIGGGIGITPFLARMKQLSHRPDGKRVDLFHCTHEVDEEALRRLFEDAKAADVRLHLVVHGRHGRLTGDRIREEVPDWRDASIWFCGPSAMGKAFEADFAAEGLAVGTRFHQELFRMR